MAPPRTGQSSGRHQPTRISADDFALAGPSNPPDPDFNAYRKDLADVALTGRVIASHYAEPIERQVRQVAELRAAASVESEAIRELAAGEPFQMLDDSLGWAWGYAGRDGRVGYVRSETLG